MASELPSYEVELIEDLDDHHVVNKQSFVDEQEWHLYMHTECTRRDIVIDQADNSVRRSALAVKCRAARRPGYFVWNIFVVTVRLFNVTQYLQWYYISLIEPCKHFRVHSRLTQSKSSPAIGQITCAVIYIKWSCKCPLLREIWIWILPVTRLYS